MRARNGVCAIQGKTKEAPGIAVTTRERGRITGGFDMTQRTCVECGVSIEGTARKKFCSDLCSWRMKEKRKRDRGYYRRPDVMARQRRIKKAQYDKEVEEGVRSGRRSEERRVGKEWRARGGGHRREKSER